MFNGSGGCLVEEAECAASVGQAVKWDREESQLPQNAERQSGGGQKWEQHHKHNAQKILYAFVSWVWTKVVYSNA